MLIIGGGLAGLTCARELGRECLVLERQEDVGGVAASRHRGGFTFDCTGHWLHLADAWTRGLVGDLFGPSEMVRIERRAAIVSAGVRTPYPFQANTYGRPVEVVAACVLGYFAARERKRLGAVAEVESFEDYVRQELGDGVAEHFMLPYNTKLWCTSPRELDASWCRRFVPTPTPEEVVLGALRPAGAGHTLGYNAAFLYPRQGGIGELSRRLRGVLPAPVRTGSEVVHIDWEARSLRLRHGEELGYEALVSTMPLCDLVDRLHPLPEALRDARQALRSVSVTYWNVGLRGANGPEDDHWTYFPDGDVPFYRVGSPSAVLASLAPEGHRSYYVEVSHPYGRPVSCDDGAALDGLRHVGLVGAREEPVLLDRETIPHAYVVMDRAYGSARDTLLAWLRAQHIWSIGRYGGWTYDSMEGAMLQGRDAARAIKTGPS